MQGVIKAAEQVRSPLIVQISVKTVKFGSRSRPAHVHGHGHPRHGAHHPHLDHCPDPMARTCLKVGWNSVLFDGSGMSFEENQRLTKEIVKDAKALGAAVEGEVVAVAGVEDGMGSDAEGDLLRREGTRVHRGHRHLLLCAADRHGPWLLQGAPTIRYDRME